MLYLISRLYIVSLSNSFIFLIVIFLKYNSYISRCNTLMALSHPIEHVNRIFLKTT